MAVLSTTIALAALGVAMLALWTARGVGRRLRLMDRSLWELRYEHSRLKARVERLAPEPADPAKAASAEAAAREGEVGFVPMRSLTRRGPDDR